MLKGTKAYVQTKFSTAGQGDVLILLYDGALKFLTQAKEKMIEKDVAAKGNLISKTLDIINELDCALNVEAGGELAQNLHQLYLICSTRLLQANLRMDPTLLDNVSDILSGLRSAYVQIMNTPEAQAASTQIASKMSPTGAQMQRAAPLPQTTASSGIGRAQAQNAYGAAQKDFKDPLETTTPPKVAAQAGIQSGMQANAQTAQAAQANMQGTAQASAQVTMQTSMQAGMPAAVTGQISQATSPATAQANPVTPSASSTMAPSATVPPAASATVAPAPTTTPATEFTPPPPVNLAARRLAASNRYGQVAQVSGA